MAHDAPALRTKPACTQGRSAVAKDDVGGWLASPKGEINEAKRNKNDEEKGDNAEINGEKVKEDKEKESDPLSGEKEPTETL